MTKIILVMVHKLRSLFSGLFILPCGRTMTGTCRSGAEVLTGPALLRDSYLLYKETVNGRPPCYHVECCRLQGMNARLLQG
jgi:hypothetical protein